MAGKLVHFEVPSRDGDRARSFWSGVFGWQFDDAGMPDLDYHMVRTGEDQGGAVYTDDETGGKGVVVYFDTDDSDASIAKRASTAARQAASSRSRTSAGSRAARTPRATRSACSRATSRCRCRR